MHVKSAIKTEQEETQSIDLQELRQAISKEYEAVAQPPLERQTNYETNVLCSTNNQKSSL